jgi:hypothetical protein
MPDHGVHDGAIWPFTMTEIRTCGRRPIVNTRIGSS